MKFVFYRYVMKVDEHRSFEARGVAPQYDYQMLRADMTRPPPVGLEILFESPSWEAAKGLFRALFVLREQND